MYVHGIQVQLPLNTCRKALTAWRSGHSISLQDRRPGFESFQGIRFLGKHSNAVGVFDLVCIVCVLKRRNKKGIGPPIFFKHVQNATYINYACQLTGLANLI
jgi:hypothetical protein